MPAKTGATARTHRRSHSSKTAGPTRRTVPPMTSISFFELGVDDAEKAQAFYGAMFGWEFETGPAMQGYAIKTPGVPGGLHPNDKGAWPYVFFAVDDLDAALERVKALGGEVQDG